MSYFPIKETKFPKIYAYMFVDNPEFLKIGFTTREVEVRVKEQVHPVNVPKELKTNYKIVFQKPAFKNDGSEFNDHLIHTILENSNIERLDGEWFRCTVDELEKSYNAAVYEKRHISNAKYDFKLRPEQKEAVDKTAEYFENEISSGKVPHFLWNAKMRFGKTFTTYKFAQQMNFKKILIITYKPAVEDSWKTDLLNHIDFKDFNFYSAKELKENKWKTDERVVLFGSFQDLLGKEKGSTIIKSKNKLIHETQWDLVVMDEYHFGAWNKASKSLFNNINTGNDDNFILDEYESIIKEEIGVDALTDLHESNDISDAISANGYLYLSGTPFRSLQTGEFIENQIFTWTYSDEQKSKEEWKGNNNPYYDLPKMILLTYEMPNSLQNVINKTGKDEFDLNEFFKTKIINGKSRFEYEDAVQRWISIIQGKESMMEGNTSSLSSTNKPIIPFRSQEIMQHLNHTMWFLKDVGACDAMETLLKSKNNIFFNDFKIINASGTKAGIGVEALKPVSAAYGLNPISSKTIILTCGKLTTGVTIKPLSGVFMLRNCSSAETYFQTAFRAQSPWSISDENGKKLLMKENCYIFDFAPNRALNQLVEYCTSLDSKTDLTNQQKIDNFINFLPVLQFDGTTMKEVNALEILDFVKSGTSSTLLAKKWNSALLVNVDNETLNRLLKDDKALEAIMKIEGIRSLGNNSIKEIINLSERIKKIKALKTIDGSTKKELTKYEKEIKSKRKLIQEKLVKFATRIPVFMYLTDFREEKLKDVIVNLDSKLFEKVTGLSVQDFELLVSYNVFNAEKMNLAISQFKEYEDSSLNYSGINKHINEKNGLYDIVI